MRSERQQIGEMRTTVLVPEAIIPNRSDRNSRWGLWLALLLTGMIAGIALLWSLGLVSVPDDEPLTSIEALPPPPATPRSPYPSELPDLSGRSAAPQEPMIPVTPPAPIAEPPMMKVEPPAPLPEARPLPPPVATTIARPTAPRRTPLQVTRAPVPAIPPVPANARRLPAMTPRQLPSRVAAAPARSLTGSLAALIGPGDYPAASRRAGQQGDVTVRLAVGTDGRVARCVVLASNASEPLEAATCQVLTRRARFAPAIDGKGSAVAGAVVQHIAWR